MGQLGSDSRDLPAADLPALRLILRAGKAGVRKPFLRLDLKRSPNER